MIHDVKCDIKATTEIFTPGAALYARAEMSRLLGKTAIPLSLPVITLATIGMSDWRYIILAAIIIFMVYPSCAAIAWFRMLAKPEAVKAVFPRKIALTADNSMIITYYGLQTASESDHGCDTESNKDMKPTGTDIIKRDQATGCEIKGNRIIITCAGCAPETVIITEKAFSSESHLMQFYSALVTD